MDLVLLFSFIAFLAAFAPHGGNSVWVNVMNYGAVGDGKYDDTKAFSNAWKALCGFGGLQSTLLVPEGNFLLSPVTFEGPCKSSTVRVKVLGNLTAPSELSAWKGCTGDSWLYFSGINRLTVFGSGKINAHGELWWKNYGSHSTLSYNENSYGCNRPTAVKFFRCNGLNLMGLTHLNSPRNHISIDRCNDVNITRLQILAPKDSPNTDGIDISSSTFVLISRSNMQTGDDCVAINSGCSDIRIRGVACGPGHGISVGSLGKDRSYASVERVFVNGCNFTGAQNGVRIKTWPGGSGYARDIHFRNIILRDVENPIIIDQYYCNGEFDCADQPSAVEISHVTYGAVRGSSTKEQAIQLCCSKSKPCTNIQMYKVNIFSAVRGGKTYAICNNTQGAAFLTTPNVPCLYKHKIS